MFLIVICRKNWGDAFHHQKKSPGSFPEFPQKRRRGEMFTQESPNPESVGERGSASPTLGGASSWNTG